MGALLALVGLVLVLFELLLITRIVVDLVSVLAKPGYEARFGPVCRAVYRLTEPILAPVRRVVPPVRMGGVSFDLALTLVFAAVVVLRQLVIVV
ncbi:MAG: YggT family protein [Pseudonocardiales bacterium]|nr:YggT family protein [Pseudonocardiales bacterium]